MGDNSGIGFPVRRRAPGGGKGRRGKEQRAARFAAEPFLPILILLILEAGVEQSSGLLKVGQIETGNRGYAEWKDVARKKEVCRLA